VHMGRTTFVPNGPRFALPTQPAAKDLPNLIFAIYTVT